jgi:hypothetical protein
MMRRVAAATIVALALIPSAAAASALSIVGTDSAGYPHLVVNVVTPSPVASPPGLEEDGVPVAALQAVNLGAAKSIVVAIDNSQSMKGRSIVDAGAAASSMRRRQPTELRCSSSAGMSYSSRASRPLRPRRTVS